MRYGLFAFGIAVLLSGLASAQGLISPVTEADPEVGRQPAGTPSKVADTFMIEMKILEGKELLGETPAGRKAYRRIAGVLGAVIADNSRTRTTPPAPVGAILPNPVASPQSEDRRLEATPKYEEEDLWDAVGRAPGVTVLAAPKLAVVGGQSAIFQIQSEQPFVYLEPLGDGKFEAKHTAPQELGMKFILAVQPVTGDDKSVDISLLEIQLSVLDGREPVEGLDLEVGKPIFATRSLKTSARMKLSVARMIPLPSGPKKQAVLLLRVKRIAVQKLSAPQPFPSRDRDGSSP